MAVAILAAGLLVACSPAPDAIKQCQAEAGNEARGHALDSIDLGELVEACMLKKGWALDERRGSCTDDYQTAVTPGCYYRDNFLGRAFQGASTD